MILKRDLSAEKADKFLIALKNAGLLARKEEIAPTVALQKEAPPSSVDKPEKTEAGGMSSGGWDTPGTNNTAALAAYGLGSTPTAHPQHPPQSISTESIPPTAREYTPESYSGDDTEEFAELSWFSFEGRLGRIRYFCWLTISGMLMSVSVALSNEWKIFLVPIFVGWTIAMGCYLKVRLDLDDSIWRVVPAFLIFSTVILFKSSIVLTWALVGTAGVFNLSVIMRRLHDINVNGLWAFLYLGMFAHLINAPGWSALLYLITVVIGLFMLALLFWPGDAGENDYDLPPPPNTIALKITAGVLIMLFVGGIVAAIVIPHVYQAIQ
ncbi:MAG: DUF805 domain-containing protein [Betaproteobacteria bacterium]|nr:DUF805 domain-containing protein [Betaproteobacteria bacterium]